MDRPLLVSEFEDMGLTISDDMIDECVIACLSNQISPSDFVGSWIAYCASSQIDANNLNKETLLTLVKLLNKENNKKKESNEHHTSDKQTSLEINNVNIEDEINVNNIIDAENIKEENASSAGDIACKFGHENINEADSSVDVETVCLLKQNLWDNFVFGEVNFDKLDNHIQELANDIIKKNNLSPITMLSDLRFGNDNAEITIFGSLKMIKKELFLSSEYSSIKLDLSEAVQPVKQLFVNQILVVTGTNPVTNLFKVRNVYTDATLPLSTKLPSLQGNINLMIAAGPFFSESSPHGKSLKLLIQKTIDSKAKLLILLGPIFDTDFGIHLNKSSTESLQKCYDDILEPILTPLFSNPSTQNTKLLLFSSWKDTGCYTFYPTPPNTESQLPIIFSNNIFMVSDPTIFSVNDVIIAGNACDALMGLHVSAINQNQEEMFTKLAKQFVWQRSLHPSYTANPNVPVDHLLWLEHSTWQNNTPHIILTSSQLRTFIKVVEGCMVINVGHLIKHSTKKKSVSGTYGKIQIAPPKNDCWSPKTNISAEIIYI